MPRLAPRTGTGRAEDGVGRAAGLQSAQPALRQLVRIPRRSLVPSLPALHLGKRGSLPGPCRFPWRRRWLVRIGTGHAAKCFFRPEGRASPPKPCQSSPAKRRDSSPDNSSRKSTKNRKRGRQNRPGRCVSKGHRFPSTGNPSSPLTMGTTNAWHSGNRCWIGKNCRDPKKSRASR